MTAHVRPTLQALLVADHVYTDRITGKCIVAGIFQTLTFMRAETLEKHKEKNGGKMPFLSAGFRVGSPHAFASLTNLRGKQHFTLRYVDLANDSVIFHMKIEAESTDPLATLEMAIPLPELPTDKAGVFALEMVWNDEPLGSYRIQVIENTAQELGPDNDNPPA